MTGFQVSRWLSISCLALFGFSLFFRAVLYSRMYIAPGDPYGLSDIIEFLLGSLLIGLLALSAIVAVVLGIRGPRANRIAAGWLVGVGFLIVGLAQPLHNLAAEWGAH